MKIVRKLLQLEWDVIAGIQAVIVALLLHFFHVVDIQILSSVTLIMLALLLLRDLFLKIV